MCPNSATTTHNDYKSILFLSVFLSAPIHTRTSTHPESTDATHSYGMLDEQEQKQQQEQEQQQQQQKEQQRGGEMVFRNTPPPPKKK